MHAPSSILVHKDLPTAEPIQLVQEISSSDSSPYAFIHCPFCFWCVVFTSSSKNNIISVILKVKCQQRRFAGSFFPPF